MRIFIAALCAVVFALPMLVFSVAAAGETLLAGVAAAKFDAQTNQTVINFSAFHIYNENNFAVNLRVNLKSDGLRMPLFTGQSGSLGRTIDLDPVGGMQM